MYDTTAVTLTPHALDIADRVGWQAAAELVMDSRAKAVADPYGPLSIDPDARKNVENRKGRIVHRMDNEAESLLGLPVAIKGTGEQAYSPAFQRVNLATQFTLMHSLSSAQRRLHPDGINGLFFFDEPLAYFSCPIVRRGRLIPQEWMLMARVVDGRSITNIVRGDANHRVLAFDPDRYPDLGVLAGAPDPRFISPVRLEPPLRAYRELRRPIYEKLGGLIPLDMIGDIHGENILRTGRRQSRRYTIIDAQPYRPRPDQLVQD